MARGALPLQETSASVLSSLLMHSLVFLHSQPLAVLLLCLALGSLLGRTKWGLLPANATLGTLLASVAANLLFRAFGLPFSFPGELQALAFAFFSFALGYSAGPGFVEALRRDGRTSVLRQMALAASYALFAALAAALAAHGLRLSGEGTLRGLLAGALTQSTILGSSSSSDSGMMVAYAVSYAVGMAAIILFVQSFAPRFLGTTPAAAVKRHLDAAGAAGAVRTPVGFSLPARAIQMRAYRILPDSAIVGQTVAQVESAGARRFEIAAIHRAGGPAAESGLSQETVVGPGDVLVAIGDMRVIGDLPRARIEETVDDRFLFAPFVLADVVLVEGAGPDILCDLTGRGILLRSALRGDRPLPAERLGEIRAGDVLRVAGLGPAVEAFAARHGYVRDDGAPSDIPALAASLAAAVLLGALSLRGVSLGTGCCALLLGMALGCLHRRHPRFAHIPRPALLLARTLGLNLFVACVSLGAPLSLSALSGDLVARLATAALLVALIPLLGTFAVGRFLLRLPPVPLLGGLCGAGTCTPALNALEEETGSSAFTAAYTIPYVLSNILLTLLGSLVVSCLH